MWKNVWFFCVVKNKIEACETCRQLFTRDGYVAEETVVDGSVTDSSGSADNNPELKDKDQLIRELELELAQTKLALVESECKNQDLLHQLNATAIEAQSSKNTWFQKTLSSIKEVTNKAKESSSSSLVMSLGNSVATTKDSAAGRRDNWQGGASCCVLLLQLLGPQHSRLASVSCRGNCVVVMTTVAMICCHKSNVVAWWY